MQFGRLFNLTWAAPSGRALVLFADDPRLPSGCERREWIASYGSLRPEASRRALGSDPRSDTAPPTCECFSLCTARAFASFHMRLPMVTSTASPWYNYVRQVYQTPVPLPFAVASLELFYPAMLPTSMCHNHGESPDVRLPSCLAGNPVCDGWLNRSEPVPSGPAITLYLAQRAYIASPAFLAAHAVRRRAPLSQFIVLQEDARHIAASGEWVEVARMPPHRDPEGTSGIGCWFYPARGSGVHVRLHRTIAFRTRDQALRRRGYGVWEGVNNTVLSSSDWNVAKAAAREGFVSVQLLYGNTHVLYGVGSAGGSRAPTRELILAHEVCMKQRERLGAGCVPVKTLTGWKASLPCACAEAAAVGAVGLNCGATPRAAAKAW